MEYTREDVIVWEDDKRLENLNEGDEIWTGDNYRWLLEQANKNRKPDWFICVDPTCDNTFVFKYEGGISTAPFIIIKKKPANISADEGKQHLPKCDGCPFALDHNGSVYCKLTDSYPLNKEKQKEELVPFDFSLEEDRKALKGRWIRQKEPHGDIEFMVNRFERNYFMAYLNDEFKLYGITGEDMLKDFVFSDTGLPAGKEVEE